MSRHHTRRTFLNISAACASLTLSPWIARRALAADPPPALPPLNRFPRMVHDYMTQMVREAAEHGRKLRDAVNSKADAEKYVESVRQRIRESFGPFPEKTPLNPKITGVLKRDGYRVEKVIFESRPGFLVTANLYLPETGKAKMPGVVGTCGHSANGKAAEAYQSFAQGLARMGYVVLIYDPLGQGERLQYPDEKLKSTVGVGVNEHLLAGNQQFLVGEFIGAWRAWDGIRALDYLLTREEVDTKHLGITGNSGGGTMTTWLCGVEQRFTMAAPSCFVTTFRRNLENELPADTEQCPPRSIALGLDHADFIAALAPKPVILLGQEKDFFDVRGTTEAYEGLKRLYTHLGAPDNIALYIGPRNHGYWVENREAMYKWFNKFTGVSDAQKEPELKLEKDEDLYCAPKGQVAELQSRTVMSYTKEISQRLGQRRFTARQDLPTRMGQVLKLPAREGVPDYRILRTLSARKYPSKSCAHYAVTTEPGIEAIVTMLTDAAHVARPPRGEGKAILYVSHQSADAELRDEPLLRELYQADSKRPFFAMDVRGVGESKPDTCGNNTFLSPYGSDYFYAIHSIMLDKPYLGQKTHDVLRVLDWLADNGYGDVHLAAKGWGALSGAFAAVLHPAVKQVTLKHALTSYAEIAQTQTYKWPLSTLLLGVLQQFDLPEVYAALDKKGLKQVEPWGASAG